MTHYWETLDGWFAFQAAYIRILAALPSHRPSTVVELGTWVGRSTAYLGVEIVNSRKPVTLIAVDLFQGSAEIEGTKRASQVPSSEAVFRHNMAPVAEALGDRFRILVDDSAAAADRFADGSVDAVWVDAAHGYGFVKADLAAWIPKIRPAGIIGGDDYTRCPGVKLAVDERFGTLAEVHPPWWIVEGLA